MNKDQLIEGVCQGITERSAARHVLLIEDTTELNYQAHAGRVSGLGTVGNGVDAGMFLHPVLAVDAQDGSCLGLAHVHLWLRTTGNAAHYQRLPIEDKESYRWIDSVEQARKRLASDAQMTVITDREGDIYQMWARLPDARTQLLIRANRNRLLHAEQAGEQLFEWLQALPVQGSCALDVPSRPGKRTAHTAQLHIRFGRTHIKRAKNCSDPLAPPSLALWAIDIQEAASSVVGKESPIHWRLLSTHAIHNVEQALQCVRWYCQRWHIEQTFRTLKRQGLDVESSLLEQAHQLQNLAVLALSAAVHTMQLTLAREGHNTRPASDCFSADSERLLAQLNRRLQGATLKQKNPHPPQSLAWAAWVVARLGGWKGYASERKPGPITMGNGLRTLHDIQRGWALAQAGDEGGKDVCMH